MIEFYSSPFMSWWKGRPFKDPNGFRCLWDGEIRWCGGSYFDISRARIAFNGFCSILLIQQDSRKFLQEYSCKSSALIIGDQRWFFLSRFPKILQCFTKRWLVSARRKLRFCSCRASKHPESKFEAAIMLLPESEILHEAILNLKANAQHTRFHLLLLLCSKKCSRNY